MAVSNQLKTISLCLNIEGFLRSNQYPAGFDIFQKSDGTSMSAADALTFLTLEKAKGHMVIPCSAECGNPCRHAQNGCTGFDYGARGGCPGRYAKSDISVDKENI